MGEEPKTLRPDSLWRQWEPLEDPALKEVIERTLADAQDNGLSEDEALELVTDAVVAANEKETQRRRRGIASALRESAPTMLAEHRILRRQFERRLDWVWGDALDQLFAILIASEELGRSLGEIAGDTEASDDTVEALRRLHARACVTASEIHALLRTGHYLGARARWRTLHEIAVITAVIGRADPEIAERFIAHADIEAFKDAQKHEEYLERTGWTPIGPERMAELKEERDKALAMYGSDFGNPWMWAKPLVPEGRGVGFWQLEKLAELDHLRPTVLIANHLVHAGSSGAAFVVVDFRGHQALLHGPTNIGLAEPGHATAVSLMQATTHAIFDVAQSRITPSILASVLALQDLTKDAGEAFAAANRRVEQMEVEFSAAAERGRFAVYRLLLTRLARMALWRAPRLLPSSRVRLRRSGSWFRLRLEDGVVIWRDRPE